MPKARKDHSLKRQEQSEPDSDMIQMLKLPDKNIKITMSSMINVLVQKMENMQSQKTRSSDT